MIAKAELHVHLEGTISPRLVKQLAAKNKIAINPALFKDEETFAWNDFNEFMRAYDLASEVIKSPMDLHAVTYQYLAECAKEGAIYVELIASPDHAKLSGNMTYLDMLEAVTGGMQQAKEEFGIESRILLAAVRHFGAERCEAVAKLAEKHPHPMVTGYNLAGDEINFPPKLFVKAFAMAAGAGLGCTCHSGEWCGPESIREAITLLPLQRISHGVRAIEDASLIQEIIDRNITLECAVGSNIALGVYQSFAQHPLAKLKAAGVKITLNSDDPPFFATTIGHEYYLAEKYFGFDEQDLQAMTANAINAGFIPEQIKQTLLAKI